MRSDPSIQSLGVRGRTSPRSVATPIGGGGVAGLFVTSCGLADALLVIRLVRKIVIRVVPRQTTLMTRQITTLWTTQWTSAVACDSGSRGAATSNESRCADRPSTLALLLRDLLQKLFSLVLLVTNTSCSKRKNTSCNTVRNTGVACDSGIVPAQLRSPDNLLATAHASDAWTMRLAWATDIHLDFLDSAEIDRFHAALAQTGADAFLIGGDIAEARTIEARLIGMAESLRKPIYFVLGNHDFYNGSIELVRAAVSALCRASPWLRWLPDLGVVPLTAASALVGHDGWGDARLGNVATTPVVLNDFFRIEELRFMSGGERRRRLQTLGDESAAHMTQVLPLALRDFAQVVVLTHVPPFRDSCWHEGKVSDDDWLPYFTCDAMGAVLQKQMAANPNRTATVLCGHTHGEGTVSMAPNLAVWTGGAEYGQPRVARVFDVP